MVQEPDVESELSIIHCLTFSSVSQSFGYHWNAGAFSGRMVSPFDERCVWAGRSKVHDRPGHAESGATRRVYFARAATRIK